MIHHKKIKKDFFEKVATGFKPYEIRLNDCDYRKDDFMVLNEVDRDKYTGRFCIVRITDILEDPYNEYIKEGYVVMTIAPCIIKQSNWDMRSGVPIYQDTRYKKDNETQEKK